MDTDSDSDYINRSDGEVGTSDSQSSDFDEDSIQESDAETIDYDPGRWEMIGDPFEDEHPEQVPEFLGMSGVNEDKYPDNELTFTAALNMLLPEDIFIHLADCTNEKAAKHFVALRDVPHKIH